MFFVFLVLGFYQTNTESRTPLRRRAIWPARENRTGWFQAKKPVPHVIPERTFEMCAAHVGPLLGGCLLFRVCWQVPLRIALWAMSSSKKLLEDCQLLCVLLKET